MAISPPSDIVLDVVRAADPASVEAAKTRLASFAGPTSGATFSVETTSDGGRATRAANIPARPEAFERFEAMVLQNFIGAMLPKDTGSVYGQEMAGEMWQSMLAEQLGTVMADRGGIGISDRILHDYYTRGDEKVPLQGVSHDPNQAERATQQNLSTALLDELERKMAQSLNEDRAAVSTSVSSR